MLGECDAALVTGCRPRMLAKPRIIREHARVGRQELRLVAMDRRHHATSDEVGRVLEQPDELVDHLGDLDRHGAPGAARDPRGGTPALPHAARATCAAARLPAHACLRCSCRGSSRAARRAARRRSRRSPDRPRTIAPGRRRRCALRVLPRGFPPPGRAPYRASPVRHQRRGRAAAAGL